MGSEVLAVPEDRVIEVVNVIREGLMQVDRLSQDTIDNLTKWCDDMELYYGTVNGDCLPPWHEGYNTGLQGAANKVMDELHPIRSRNR